LAGNVAGNLAGVGSVGIMADVTGGITVVTGVDGAEVMVEGLPAKNERLN
jgi:hypothetical protein